MSITQAEDDSEITHISVRWVGRTAVFPCCGDASVGNSVTLQPHIEVQHFFADMRIGLQHNFQSGIDARLVESEGMGTTTCCRIHQTLRSNIVVTNRCICSQQGLDYRIGQHFDLDQSTTLQQEKREELIR